MERIIALVVSGAFLGMSLACSIVAPSLIANAPEHHNIPATFAGHPEGPMVWLCATQPRQYITPDGKSHSEEDHYLQYTPCPSMPIQ